MKLTEIRNNIKQLNINTILRLIRETNEDSVVKQLYNELPADRVGDKVFTELETLGDLSHLTYVRISNESKYYKISGNVTRKTN